MDQQAGMRLAGRPEILLHPKMPGLMAGKIPTAPGRNLIGHGGSGIDDGGVWSSPAANRIRWFMSLIA